MTRFGGIVLCGGASKRMGRPKAWLPFGHEPLLARVVRTLAGVVRPVAIVAAAGEPLPTLPDQVLLTFDRVSGRGPLEGIAAGLEKLAGEVDAAFVCGCDAALLSADVVRYLCQALGEFDAVVPVIDGHWQTLAAVYRTRALPVLDSLLADGERKAYRLFDRIATRFVEAGQIRSIDRHLRSFQTMNTPEEYLAALAAAGLPVTDAGQSHLLFGD